MDALLMALFHVILFFSFCALSYVVGIVVYEFFYFIRNRKR